MEGLTYETRSQAETAMGDFHTQGYLAKIVRTPEGKFKVLITSGLKPSPEEELGELELEVTEPTEEEKEEEMFEKEERREARREAKHLPKEIQKRKLEARRKELEREMAKRERMKLEKGTIVEVRDPNTYEVIDYKLVTRDIAQRAAETVSKKVPEGLSKLPTAATGFAEGIVSHTARQMDVKKGMKASIPGQAPMPRAVIAWLPEKDEGYVGVRRPAIGKIGKVGRIGIPIIRRKE